MVCVSGRVVTRYHLIWDGQINPVQIGRSVRFAVAERERFLVMCAADEGVES